MDRQVLVGRVLSTKVGLEEVEKTLEQFCSVLLWPHVGFVSASDEFIKELERVSGELQSLADELKKGVS